MKVEIRANGRTEVYLTPETVIQIAAMEELIAAVTKGRMVELFRDPGPALVGVTSLTVVLRIKE